MSKRSKLLLIKLNKSLTGILILLLLFLQLNAGLTTGMAVDIHENAFTSSKSLLLENGDIFSHPTLADESNPSIARLINREENEFFEQGLRIPENKNTVASNTSFSGNSDTPENLAINIDLEKPFYVPGETVHFLIQLTGNLNGDFVPISGESVSVQIYHGWEESIAFLSGLTDNEGLWEAAYDPPKEGTYMLEVSVEGSYRKRWAEFTVSSLGLFWRHPWEFMPGQEIRAYAMVLNTSTLTPIENAQLDLSIRQHDNEWTEVYSGISDSNGICDIRYIIDTGSSYSYEANISAHFNDKSVSIVQWLYQYWDYSYYQDDDRSSGEFDIITTTDKPLYKPGEQIYFRSLVWEQNHLTVSKKPVQVPIELTFVSPSGYTLLRKNLQTSSNGIASDSIKLDESAELGNYSIIAKVDSSSSTTIVKVDRYERPDFRVSATISPDYSDSKINLVGKIRAEYYFGQPVVEGQVEVDIILDGDLLQSKSGKLSKKGEWTFHLSISQSDTNYVIDVKVTDSVGRSVESKTDLPGRSAIEIYSYVSPKLALPEDEIYCSVWAYDRSSSDYYWGHPITDGTAHFEIYGIISILFGTKSIKLKEFNSDLNDWGYASASWTLSEEEIASFTSFRVKIQIETADGREGSAEEYYSYSRKTVKINIPEAVYQPGNAVTISVTVKDRFLNKDTWVNGRLYVFDLDWDAIGYIDKTFSGTSSITFRLSPYARSGQYLVGLQIREEIELDEFVWRHYQYVKATFQVGPEASIILSTTKESFVAGENIEIQGSHSFETSAPLILETVKRGIVELYVLEPKSSFSIQIENSMLLAPNFALNAYLIDRQGFLQTASLRIEVNGSVSLDIQFDKPRYEPGDSVEVSMMMKNALGSYIPAIGAISLIDSSVYGVLPDPEEEAEHFEEETYYPVVMTRSSWMGGDFYWWWIFYDIVYGGSYGFARGGGYPEYYLAEDTEYFSIESTRREFTPSPQQEVKIRDNLPEAAYWHPEISLTTSDTELSLVLPDNIGEWTVRVVATTASGQGVLQKASLTTFLPFFVDLEKPLVLSQDDVIAVKGVAYNYLNETASIDLKLNVSTGLEPLIASEQSLIIPPLHLGSIEWPVYIESFGKMDASLIGVARTTEGTWTDGIRVPLSVLPNGAYRIERQGGYLNESANLPINISQSAISVQGTLILSPGLSNVALSSWERLIGYPYGCTEQTLSRILPDALVYAYLNQTDQLDPDTAKELENMIIVGLSRLYAFQKSSGGWGWWSDDHHNTYMTAIVLYGLGLIHNVGFEVEMDVLSSGAEYLLNAQDSDFLWRTSVWRLDSYSFTAFVLRSLLFANESYVSQPKVYSAYSKLKALWNESKNPYAAALLLDGLGGSSILETDFEGELISYLQSSANHVETGSFWTIDDHRWRALGGDVETTAIALTALARWDLASSFSLIQRAIDWITTKQQPWGWGSTADTSAAIRALLTVDDMVSNEDTEAEIHVILNGNDQIFPFSSKSPESMVSTVIKLGNELHEGMNTLQITQNGTGFFFYLLTVEQVLRDDPTIEIEGNIDTSPGSEFPVSITLLPPSADVRIVDLQVKSLEMDLPISTSDTRTLTTLSEKITFVFVYTAPSEVTELTLDGFEVSYYFQDIASLKISQIPVVRQYGPIAVSVSSESSDMTESYFSNHNSIDETSSELTGLLNDSVYDVKKKLSKNRNLDLGETIIVTLEINYTGDTDEYFLMVEDFQSAGLQPDESSLKISTGISDVSYSGDRITIFISHLSPHSTLSYSYRVFVTDIKTSSIQPALLSSMYDDWIVASRLEDFSASSVLSLIDPVTREMLKDHEKPVISEQTSVQLSADETTIYLEIQGLVTDNLELGELKILGGIGEIWMTEEFSLSGKSSSFATTISIETANAGLEQVTVLIEVRDQFGNAETRMFQQEVKTFIADPIPVLGIAMLILVAVLSASAMSRSFAHWGRKRLKEGN